jgi:hypothetical protein
MSQSPLFSAQAKCKASTGLMPIVFNSYTINQGAWDAPYALIKRQPTL